MQKHSVYLTYSDLITPAGIGFRGNMEVLRKGISAIRSHSDWGFASAFSKEEQQTFFRHFFSPDFPSASAMLSLLGERFLAQSEMDVAEPETKWILCSTKGDIEALSKTEPGASPLLLLAENFRKKLGLLETPLVLSNACISGLQGIILGQRWIASGKYKKVIVLGVDSVNSFVTGGFKSLMAIDERPCRPFDKNRKGLSPGEAAAILVLERTPKAANPIVVMGGAVSNDANHISGPSRDGSGLAAAIINALRYSGVETFPEDAFVCAHATGTLYNDEMEAFAFHRSEIQSSPVTALKGYFGHTMGASGVLETVLSAAFLREKFLPASAGFVSQGTTLPINISSSRIERSFSGFMKTAAGFGGCNAAALFKILN